MRTTGYSSRATSWPGTRQCTRSSPSPCLAASGSSPTCYSVERMTRADLDKKPAEVAAMFDALAGRYDLMNDVLSMGQVRLWRKSVQRILRVGPGDRVLDLAAGTGTSSLSFAASGADVVACDFSLGMLQAGQARAGRGGGAQSDPLQAKT